MDRTINICTYRASEVESCMPETANILFENSSVFGLTTHQAIGIYGGIIGTSGILITFRAILCYLLCFAAARSLHNKISSRCYAHRFCFFILTQLVGLKHIRYS